MDTHHQEATADAIAERERRGVLLPRVNLRRKKAAQQVVAQ